MKMKNYFAVALVTAFEPLAVIALIVNSPAVQVYARADSPRPQRLEVRMGYESLA